MGDGGQSGSGGRSSRAVELAVAAWAGAGVTLFLIGLPRLFGVALGAEMRLWLSVLTFVWICIAFVVAVVRTARSLVLRRPPDNGPGA